MIPSINMIVESKPQIETSKTYYLNYDKNEIVGKAEGLQAIKQAIYKILNTERYDYAIYSFNYGIELKDLYGKPMAYCESEIKRRIKEALLQDNRISDVNNFAFERVRKALHVTFTAITNAGNIDSEIEVNV